MARRGSTINGPGAISMARLASGSRLAGEGDGENGSGFGTGGGDAGGNAWVQLVAGLEALLASLPQPSATQASAAEQSEDEDWELELATPDTKGKANHVEEDAEEWEKDIVIEDSADEDSGMGKQDSRKTEEKEKGTGVNGGGLVLGDGDDELIIEDSDDDQDQNQGPKEASKASVNTDQLDKWNEDLENLEIQLEKTQRDGDKVEPSIHFPLSFHD